METQVELSNGIVDTSSNRPFTVLIANFSKRHQTKSVHQVVGQALRIPTINSTEIIEKVAEQEKTFGVDNIDLSYAPENLRGKIRLMLKKHECMGKINVIEHRIWVQEGAKPECMWPYSMGQITWDEERKQVPNMLEQDVIEPAASEWAAPVVTLPKPNNQESGVFASTGSR